jgi:hypothetical protein
MDTNALAVLDHAARSSDRWLFLASLAITGLCVAWFVRWIITTYTRTVKDLTIVVERNTEAMAQVKVAIDYFRVRPPRDS